MDSSTGAGFVLGGMFIFIILVFVGAFIFCGIENATAEELPDVKYECIVEDKEICKGNCYMTVVSDDLVREIRVSKEVYAKYADGDKVQVIKTGRTCISGEYYEYEIE